ncbi:MAG: hypothetical protein ACREBC_30710, partial [Pyrinomonadaceae bacterium]
MTRARRDIEINTLRLLRTRWILERAQLRYSLLGDLAGAQAINRIIRDVEAERQRWLRSVDNPIP